VRVDEKRLMQVLLNLLGNAIKFTERGRVTLRIEVLDDQHEEGRTVRFLVKDTGPGIAPDHLARIFEPFEQVGDQKARAQGTGLGLSITRRIVEALGGSMEVESEIGKGSVFTVTLRLSEVATAASASSASFGEIMGYEGERRTLLVVDDNADNRALVRELLAPLGFSLVEAESGMSALALAAAERPSLILLDLAMPDMDGYETARRLRQIPGLGETVMIASSASISPAQQENSLRAGCNDFLPKPVDAGALFALLERHLGHAWIRTEAERTDPTVRLNNAELVALTPPPAARLEQLLALVKKGRTRDVVDEVQRLEEQAPELEPWARQVRALAQSFQMKRLRDILQAQVRAFNSGS
jgi:CheY-like chemotaxis protein/anti-sigma regulatory factor (Ser/Thr protein kinase)